MLMGIVNTVPKVFKTSMEGTNFFVAHNSNVDVALTDEKGNARLIKCTVANLPTVAGYAIGCIAMTEAGALYTNQGTATVASFVITSTVTAGSVTLAMLATGVTPSHVVKYAGTASGGTTATRAYTVTGALSTDVATAVIRASTNATTIQKATLSTDTLTVLFAADPGAGTTVDYSVLRAAV